ncbi:hypothetical protein Tco_0471076 [Tanacetum coccineum]
MICHISTTCFANVVAQLGMKSTCYENVLTTGFPTSDITLDLHPTYHTSRIKHRVVGSVNSAKTGENENDEVCMANSSKEGGEGRQLNEDKTEGGKRDFGYDSGCKSMNEHQTNTVSQPDEPVNVQTDSCNETVKASFEGCNDGRVNDTSYVNMAKSYQNMVNNKLSHIPTKLNDDGNEVYKRAKCIASRLGKPVIMDAMTTKMCNQGIGRFEYARVLIEVDAKKGLHESINIQYCDKEEKIIATKSNKSKTQERSKGDTEQRVQVGDDFEIVKNKRTGGVGLKQQQKRADHNNMGNNREEGDEVREESSKIDCMTDVDRYVLARQDPPLNVTSKWTREMINYFKDKWSEVYGSGN